MLHTEQSIHLTPTLEEKIINLKQPLTTSNWVAEAESYVPLRGSYFAYGQDDFALEEKLNEFLISNKKVLLLLGDSGSGKSLTTQRLVAEQWQNYEEGGWIPLWVGLPSLEDPLHSLMQETLAQAGWDEGNIEIARCTRKFLMVLDGYDEIRQWQNLYVTNRLEQWQVKVIITCRREYLYYRDNYHLHFMPFVGEKAQRAAYQEIIIKPFSTEQINHYLQQVVKLGQTEWQDWQRYQTVINEIPGLEVLLATPFMLKIAIDILPQLLQAYQDQSPESQMQMTQAKLYDAFIQHWFERQEKKLKEARQITEEDIKPAFWAYAKALAKAMYAAGITEVHYQPENNIFVKGKKDNNWDPFFNTKLKQISLLQTACLVREVAPQHYAFIHASFIDYFVSRSLYDEVVIESLASREENEKVKEETYQPSACFLDTYSIVQNDNFVQLSADRIWQGEKGERYKAWLFGQIEASKYNPVKSIAAANAITILNRARVTFSERHFEGIRIPNANLNDAIMDSVHLQGANLEGVNLQGTWLRNADLTGAEMSRVKFGELPSIEVIHAERCAYSPDGHWLAISIGDHNTKGETIAGKIYLYDASSLKLIHKLPQSQPRIAFSPNGQYLAYGGSDMIIKLWEIKSGKEIRKFIGHMDPIQSVVFDPQGRFLVAAAGHYSIENNDHIIRLWDMETGEELCQFQGHTKRIKNLVIDSKGHYLASGGDDGRVHLWDLDTRQRVRTFIDTINERFPRPINALAFDPKGEYLAAGSMDWTWLWDVASSAKIKEFKGESNDLAFCYEGEILVTAARRDVRLWQVSTGKELRRFVGFSIACLAYDPYRERLATVCGKKIRILELKGAKKLDVSNERLYSYNTGHDKVACDPLGRYVALGGEDSTVELWDVLTGQNVKQLPIPSSRRRRDKDRAQDVFTFDLKGKHLIAMGKYGTVWLWDVISGKVVQQFEESPCPESFQATDKYIAFIDLSYIKSIQLWDIANGKKLQPLAHANGIRALALSPEGTLLASSSGERLTNSYNNQCKLLVWDIASGKEVRELVGHTGYIAELTFSPCGQYLSSISTKDGITTIDIWNVASGNQIKQFNCENNFAATLQWAVLYNLPSTVFDPNSKRLAMVGGNKKPPVKLLDITTGDCLGAIEELPTHNINVEEISWCKTPEGEALLISSSPCIYYFKLRQQDEKIYPILHRIFFKTGSSLTLTNAIIHQVKGLEENNYALLKQCGAIGDRTVDKKVEAKNLSMEYSSDSLDSAVTIDKILEAIGKEKNDSKQLGDINITRGEISDSILSEDNYYTGDFFNLLLYHFNQERCQIKAYPSITIERIKDYIQQIHSQDKNYAFIPLNVGYDENFPQHKNHWVALIIDKSHQLIFYLDPARKTAIPTQIEELRIALDYQSTTIILNPIDFQQKEKQDGWIRHCGAYVIEIFDVFKKYIQDGKSIASNLPNSVTDNSFSLQAVLSEIPCGEAEAVLQIRKKHIEDACKVLNSDLKEPAEAQINQPQSLEILQSDSGCMTKQNCEKDYTSLFSSVAENSSIANINETLPALIEVDAKPIVNAEPNAASSNFATDNSSFTDRITENVNSDEGLVPLSASLVMGLPKIKGAFSFWKQKDAEIKRKQAENEKKYKHK